MWHNNIVTKSQYEYDCSVQSNSVSGTCQICCWQPVDIEEQSKTLEQVTFTLVKYLR